MSLFFYTQNYFKIALKLLKLNKIVYICNRLNTFRMTFEEFFAKKKIDLTALKKADNSLYEEFKKHYVAMGAKSFDHTKKFWFNRLRKSYRLEEAIVDKKEIQQPAPIVKEQQVVAAETATPSTGFKPRFKTLVKPAIAPPIEAEVKDEDVEKTQNAAISQEVTAKPAGFKPRFKAGITSSPVSEPSTSTESVDDKKEQADPTADIATKPAGFKPRFKAGVTKPATTAEPADAKQKVDAQLDQTHQQNTPAETANKPAGFKPRFKAGVTKPATAVEPTDAEQKANVQLDKTDQQDTPAETANKPAGFKPRFKAGLTKQATATEPINMEHKSEEQKDQTVKEDPLEPASKPTGFKPRFKAGVTQIKNKDNG